MAERKSDAQSTQNPPARMDAETASRLSADNSASQPKHDPNEGPRHTRGGVTTRHDATDLGVPMLPGSPDEPIGPEDALGPGPKRGDYRGRVGGGDYQPHQTVIVPDAKPGQVAVKVVAQREYAESIGDVPGRKGGVQTTERDRSE